MAKSSSKKPKSLSALAQSLDTRKRPVPTQGPGAPSRSTADQRALIERALREKASPPAKAAAVAQKPVPVPSSSPSKPAVSSAPGKFVPTSVAKASVRTPVVAPAKLAPAPVSAAASPAPAKVAPPARPAVVARPPERPSAVAPPSVRRSPGVGPSQLPTVKAATPPRGDPRRQYPRAEIQVRSTLALADDPSRTFEASLPTVNLSVGGMFLQSSYFLKLGTKLLIHLQLPGRGREVRVKGEVVRVESTSGQGGFAVRFTEYLDGSQVTLATHFLSPVLREFLAQYAREHHFEANAEYLTHTADVLAAWELKKAELGGDVWDLFPAKS